MAQKKKDLFPKNKKRKKFFKKRKDLNLSFDDVRLRPGYSDVNPKRDANLETMLSTNIPLHVPIVSADMDTVTEYEMAIAMAMNGGLGFLWKITDDNDPSAAIETQVGWVDRVKYAFNARIPNPVTINKDITLAEVESLREKYKGGFSSFVVVDENRRVIGLLTKHETDFGELDDKVEEFMVRNPFTMVEKKRKIDLKTAYDTMKKERLHKLIIVDDDYKPKGLYTWKDVKRIVKGMDPLFNRDKRGQLRVGANVGTIVDGNYQRVERLLKHHCDVLLVGTAHGNSKNVIDTVHELATQFSQYEFDIVAGNVADFGGAMALFKAGAHAVKVGIGPGSICTTRIITGVGVGQLSAIYDAGRAARKVGKYVIADGGIRYSGDIAIALAAGASSVMLGGLLARTTEAPGEIVTIEGKQYKEYRGMGSEAAMVRGSGERYFQENVAKEKLVPEGIEGRVPVEGPVHKILYSLKGGVCSGMGYVGAHTITELQAKARFKQNTDAAKKESHPHDVTITKEASNYKG